MSKTFLALLLLIVFSTATLLGFLAMDHKMTNHGQDNCAASLLQGIWCPITNGVAFAIHHLTALQSFSQTTLALSGLFITLLILGFVLSWSQVQSFRLTSFSVHLSRLATYFQYLDSDDDLILSRRSFDRWLNLTKRLSSAH